MVDCVHEIANKAIPIHIMSWMWRIAVGFWVNEYSILRVEILNFHSLGHDLSIYIILHMPSLVPGLEYDVFISYRQKDNKGEHWVTEFVNSIRAELEATFKEDISIYFDENPHDGLLEIHDVDESLREKLKCAIFIPIISQTYCDPRSFAWRNEFLTFKQLALKDPYGLKVRVGNGNSTSRILPVRIHDLDISDKQLLESEIGVLRAIDFIFRSAGVNRPLRSKDDEIQGKGVLYRDQINKLANAIKEVIVALKSPNKVTTRISGTLENQVLTQVSAAPKLKVLAIQPLINNTGSQDLEYLTSGIYEDLYSLFQKIREVKVISRLSATRLESTDVQPELLAKRLGAHILVKGTVHTISNLRKLSLQIVDLNNESVLALHEYSIDEVIAEPAQVVTWIAEQLNILLTESSKRILANSKQQMAAYDQLLQGRHLLRKGLYKESLKYFSRAADLNPDLALAHALFGMTTLMLAYECKGSVKESIVKAKSAALRALSIMPGSLEGFHVLALISMAYETNWLDVEPIFKKVYALSLSDKRAEILLSIYLDRIKNYLSESEGDDVISIPRYIRAYALLHLGLHEQALKAALEAVQQEPDSFMAHRAVGLCYLGLAQYDLACKSLETASRLTNQNATILFELIGAYIHTGQMEEAKTILEESQVNAHLVANKVYGYLGLSE